MTCFHYSDHGGALPSDLLLTAVTTEEHCLITCLSLQQLCRNTGCLLLTALQSYISYTIQAQLAAQEYTTPPEGQVLLHQSSSKKTLRQHAQMESFLTEVLSSQVCQVGISCETASVSVCGRGLEIAHTFSPKWGLHQLPPLRAQGALREMRKIIRVNGDRRHQGSKAVQRQQG